jgi:hypothetical protein
MNIIKSKYTSEDIRNHDMALDIMEIVCNDNVMSKIRFIINLIILTPYIPWAFFLIYGLVSDNSDIILLSLPFAIIGGVLRLLEPKMGNALVSRCKEKNLFFKNPANKELMSKMLNHLLCCEKALEMKDNGELLLARKGDARMMVFTNENGNQEVFPLTCNPIIVDENTWDFSGYDEEIEKMIKNDINKLEGYQEESDNITSTEGRDSVD